MRSWSSTHEAVTRLPCDHVHRRCAAGVVYPVAAGLGSVLKLHRAAGALVVSAGGAGDAVLSDRQADEPAQYAPGVDPDLHRVDSAVYRADHGPALPQYPGGDRGSRAARRLRSVWHVVADCNASGPADHDRDGTVRLHDRLQRVSVRPAHLDLAHDADLGCPAWLGIDQPRRDLEPAQRERRHWADPDT